jgi:hypothetical protein
MKTRIGFVSNSSSCSFIVIGKSTKYDRFPSDNIRGSNLDLSDNGEYDFGWGPEKLNDICSRLAFAMLQCSYISKKKRPSSDDENELNGWETDWGKMLTRVIGETSNLNLIWKLSSYSYIDHASSAEEGANTEMFNSEESLKQFIYSPGSYIQLDNDNY